MLILNECYQTMRFFSAKLSNCATSNFCDSSIVPVLNGNFFSSDISLVCLGKKYLKYYIVTAETTC